LIILTTLYQTLKIKQQQQQQSNMNNKKPIDENIKEQKYCQLTDNGKV
jgi:hypothetical protein